MSEPPKGTMRVNRKELYTSLDARIKFLHSFLEFGVGAWRPLSQQTDDVADCVHFQTTSKP